MYLGLDIGTSSVKALLIGETGDVVAEAASPLTVQRPQPMWSEQDPDAWVLAVKRAVADLPAEAKRRVQGVGLSGQMHGATLLGEDDRPLRPAILWNDGRSHAACEELERRAPRLRQIAGNIAMPGFTAPKLIWAAEHDPSVFAATRTVLLPKDYVRLALTGEKATDPSDAAGTLWLDVGARRWSPELLAATGLTKAHMPRVVDGTAVSGLLTAEASIELGVPRVPVAGGGGDNAASAIGVGVIEPGDAVLSLGTSGVLFVVTEGFQARPETSVHAFCHALPDRWHQMSVILSAASAIDTAARLSGYASVAEVAATLGGAKESDPIFLPYLSGERTPHNDPHATGVWFGLSHETERAGMVRGAMEGVAFGLADGLEALGPAHIGAITVVGGGARLAAWAPILAAALGRHLDYRAGGEMGGALGAARLGRMCVTGEDPREVCRPGALERRVEPDLDLVARMRERRALFRRLYGDLRPAFQEARR